MVCHAHEPHHIQRGDQQGQRFGPGESDSGSPEAVFGIFCRGTIGVVLGVQEFDTWLSYD